jgi:hypothetical protein
LIGRKAFPSIAKGAAEFRFALRNASFHLFEPIEMVGGSDSYLSLVILETSARIKTLLFNLLECRKRYGNEV